MSTNKSKPVIAQITGYYPPSLGGVQQRVQNLSEKLADKGYYIEVFTSSNGSTAHTYQATQSIRVHYLRSFVFASTPFMPSLFFRLMRLRRNSVMHLHVYTAYLPEIVYIVSKIRRVPYVAHIRLEMAQEGRFGFLLPIYKKWVLGPVLRNADKVICLTNDYAKLMVNRYGVAKDNIVVIPNATDFKISDKPKRNIHKPIKLLFVGRLAKQKNIPMLLEAVSSYRAKYNDDLHLYIIGEGELETDIRSKISKYNLSDIVTMRGALYGQELQNIFQQSDIFVLPTLYESFGNVYIEAMAKGLPIVTTNIEAVRDVVKNGRNGLLTDISADSLREAIHQLTENKILYRSISSNNLHDIKSYKWSVILQKMENIYEDVL